MTSHREIVRAYYPESGISGYTSVDGTVEFYGRINSILTDSMSVLDFGAGRAAWLQDDYSDYRKNLRRLQGRVARLVGCDVDSAISQNESVDEKIQIRMGDKLPFEDDTFDVIISDYVFEHISDPNAVASEFLRILKPGGWICARTPNKYSYVSILTRLIKNRVHARILRFAQPERKDIDVFPTTFRLNSKRDIAKYFTAENFDSFSYRYEAEPAYHFNSKLVFALMLTVNRLLPEVLKANLFVFLRKR